MLVSQSREPYFVSLYCHFESWTVSFSARCHISLSVNGYLAHIDGGGNMRVNGLCAVIMVLLNGSLRSRDDVGMNRSAGVGEVLH